LLSLKIQFVGREGPATIAGPPSPPSCGERIALSTRIVDMVDGVTAAPLFARRPKLPGQLHRQKPKGGRNRALLGSGCRGGSGAEIRARFLLSCLACIVEGSFTRRAKFSCAYGTPHNPRQAGDLQI
jgi:hypothetical protein